MRKSSNCRHWPEHEGPALLTVAAAVIGGGLAVSSMVASSNAADSADAATAASAQSAAANTALGQEQLDWNKQVYQDNAPQRDWAFQTAKDVASQQLDTAKQQQQIAQDTYDYQTGTFRPLEKSLVDSAQNYDTAERRADAQSQARTDVEQAFGSTQDALGRAITRTGATVGSGRGMAALADAQYAKATTMAGATTQATRNVEQQGYARQMDAASLGRNLASNQATQTALGLQAGNSAVGNSSTALADTTSGMSSLQQAYGTAINANSSAGNLYGQAADTYGKIASSNNQTLGALGSAYGSYLGRTATSDENVKSGTGKRMSGMAALAEIKDTKVDQGWKYDAAKGGPDDGGQPHDGPMAQEVQRTMGDHVAPGGKEIDLVSMQGKLLAGMQALAHKVEKLEKKAPKGKPRGMAALHEKEAA